MEIKARREFQTTSFTKAHSSGPATWLAPDETKQDLSNPLGFPEQASLEQAPRSRRAETVRHSRHALGGLLLASFLCVTLPVRPAWADAEGKDVPGLGAAIYQEGGAALFGDGPDVLNLSVGVFDANRADQAAGEFRLEYRWGQKLWFVGPMVGGLVNWDGGAFGYGGIYFDFQLDRLVLTPSAGVGGYHKGGSKSLGGTFQFRVGADVTYLLDDGSRLGIKVTHISNAHIHDTNPSEESILLTYSLPLGNMF